MPKKLSELTAATALGDADLLLIEQGGTSKQLAASVFWLPTNYIGGLITSNDSGDTDHDIAVAPGIARSLDDSTNMKLPAITTKQIDAAWVVGDDQGGLDTGSVAADTLYAIWLIKRADTGVVDVLFSASFTSPTLPTNYTNLRLIAAVVTDSAANIAQYIQSGDYFAHGVVEGIDDSALTDNTLKTGSLQVPPSCLAHIQAVLDNPTATDNATGQIFIVAGGIGHTPASDTAWARVEVAANFDALNASGSVLVDSSQNIRYGVAESSGDATLVVVTVAFTMLTRRDP